MKLNGANGSFEINNGCLVISRKDAGFFTRLNLGLQGDKAIPLNQITATQLREPGFGRGYLRLSINGRDPVGGAMEATKDENALLLDKEHLAMAKEMQAYILNQINGSDKASVASVSIADEIAKLADLMGKGHITQDEFTSKKRELLGL